MKLLTPLEVVSQFDISQEVLERQTQNGERFEIDIKVNRKWEIRYPIHSAQYTIHDLVKTNCNVTAFPNIKGGVGKTSTAMNFAHYLAHFKKRVLIIDLDPQSNATRRSGVKFNEQQSMQYLFELQLHHQKLTHDLVSKAILTINTPNTSQRVDILCNTLLSAELVEELRNEKDSNKMLSSIVDLIKDDYDEIILDLPPYPGLIMNWSLNIANSIYIVTDLESDAVLGISYILKQINILKYEHAKKIDVAGIIIQKLQPLNRQYINEMKTIIPKPDIQKVILNRINKVCEKHSIKNLYYNPQSIKYSEISTRKIPFIYNYEDLVDSLYASEGIYQAALHHLLK